MGKGKRARQRRTEEEPSTREEALEAAVDLAAALRPPEKPASACRVKGCRAFGIARHETPAGEPIWLCGRHDVEARRNLAEEAANQQLAADLVAITEPRKQLVSS